MDGVAATAVTGENTPVLLEERAEGVLRLVMNRPNARNLAGWRATAEA